MKAQHIAAAAAACALAFFASPAAAADAITWKLVNTFRLINGQEEQDRFAKEFDIYFGKAQQGSYSLDPRMWQFSYARLTEKNYQTNWNEANAQYELTNYAWSNLRRALFTIAAPAGANCQWTVNGSPVTGPAATKCSDVPADVRLDGNDIQVRVNGAPPVVSHIDVKDYLMVVLGDSYAAGEGNPHRPAHSEMQHARDGGAAVTRVTHPANWLDERCHRSLVSAPIMALLQMSRADRSGHTSYTLLDYACSGAEMDNGIMDDKDVAPAVFPYWGRETATQAAKIYENFPAEMPPVWKDLYLPSQIHQADEALCLHPKPGAACSLRHPDAVVISTGGNEAKFADDVARLVTDCSGGSCHGDLDKVMGDALQKMGPRYARLHGRIQAWSPKRVVVTTYIDPVQKKAGEFCADDYLNVLSPQFVPGYLQFLLKFADKGLTSENSEYAYNNLLVPLNKGLGAIVNSYKADHWVLASSQTAASVEHGYCSGRRWLLTYGESAIKQGVMPTERSPNQDYVKGRIGGFPTGAMHPNIFGHNATAVALIKALAK